MIDRVLQIQDSIFDGVADVILRVGSRGGNLLIGAALGKLLMLPHGKGEQ